MKFVSSFVRFLKTPFSSAILKSRVGQVVIFGGVVVMIGGLMAFEPVTRNVIATDNLCAYCHLPWEYDYRVHLSRTKPMRATPESKPPGKSALCVECHLPEGFLSSFNAYLHFASITDLFGHFRDREAERAGKWIPPRAATAYRARDRMFQYDSNTCRSCHIEEEIKPKRSRGQKAHKLALDQKKTCIECHYNLVHRQVDVRKAAFKRPESPGKK